MTQFSARAQNFLNNPNHLQKELGRPWKLELSSGDKILTLSYSPPQLEPSKVPSSLFCEVLSVFALNRSVEVIDTFSYREVENFLRDANHLSAFSLTSAESAEAEKAFGVIKWQLFAAAVFELMKKQTGFSLDYFNGWGSETLVEKNRSAAKFITEFNTVVPLGKTVEFVFAEGDTLHLKATTGKWAADSLIHFMHSLLSEFNGATGIKVVAVQ